MKELDDFLEHLLNKKSLSNSSLIAYEKDIQDFCDYFKKKEIDILKISEEDYKSYFDELKKSFKLSSFRRKLSAIKSFYKYLWKNRQVDLIYEYDLDANDLKKTEEITEKFSTESIYKNFINSLGEDIKSLQTKIISMLIAELNMSLANVFEIQIKDLRKYDFKKIVVSRDGKIFSYNTNEEIEKLLEKYYNEYAYEKRFLFGTYNISSFRKELEKYNLKLSDLKLVSYEDDETIYRKTKELYFKIGIGDEE